MNQIPHNLLRGIGSTTLGCMPVWPGLTHEVANAGAIAPAGPSGPSDARTRKGTAP